MSAERIGVKALRELLSHLPPDDDRLIMLSIDPEGNGFNPLRDVEACSFKNGDWVKFGTPGCEEVLVFWP
jgi:hypothetical protein